MDPKLYAIKFHGSVTIKTVKFTLHKNFWVVIESVHIKLVSLLYIKLYYNKKGLIIVDMYISSDDH